MMIEEVDKPITSPEPELSAAEAASEATESDTAVEIERFYHTLGNYMERLGWVLDTKREIIIDRKLYASSAESTFSAALKRLRGEELTAEESRGLQLTVEDLKKAFKTQDDREIAVRMAFSVSVFYNISNENIPPEPELESVKTIVRVMRDYAFGRVPENGKQLHRRDLEILAAAVQTATAISKEFSTSGSISPAEEAFAKDVITRYKALKQKQSQQVSGVEVVDPASR